MTGQWIDFKVVKESVSLEATLGRLGVQLRRVNQTYLRGPCPLPMHTSGTSKDTFTVNTVKNVWSCQSESCVKARAGRKGGNILDLVALMESCSIREAALKLAGWFSVESPPGPSIKTAPAKEEKAKLVAGKKEPQPELVGGGPPASEAGEQNLPLGFALKAIDCSHPYLEQRGITKETAELFGVGFFPGKGTMSGRVVVPIHNEKGEIVAYAGRSIDGSEPKYKLPAGFKKSLVLFNLHRALKAGEEGNRVRVIVVEGFFDTMRVHQAGFPCVIALMGSTLSEAQEKLLVENYDQVVIMLDGDDAGRAAAAEIASRLVRKVFTRVIEMPSGKQPDQLSSEEIQSLLEEVGKNG